MSLFQYPAGIEFLLRWAHFLAGITWIGLLYYFNFVQGEYFKEATAEAKSEAVKKLAPRALWWFRWGAMFTFLSGAFILAIRGINSWSIDISIGALLGTLMFLNVWLIIWPKQKVVCGIISGDIPNAGAKALLASRTNTLFSIPMLFFMGSSMHLPNGLLSQSSNSSVYTALAIIAILELNAIVGKTGPISSVKGVISMGFILTAVLYSVVGYM